MQSILCSLQKFVYKYSFLYCNVRCSELVITAQICHQDIPGSRRIPTDVPVERNCRNTFHSLPLLPLKPTSPPPLTIFKWYRQLSPRSKVLEKLQVEQSFKNFPAFKGTQKFIIVFTKLAIPPYPNSVQYSLDTGTYINSIFLFVPRFTKPSLLFRFSNRMAVCILSLHIRAFN
jgi:hypothetical protein